MNTSQPQWRVAGKKTCMEPTILTAAGRSFNLAQPEQSAISLMEIAHALSHICRFTGHTTKFYSVAQHSLFVSRIVPPHLAAQGLMHDAHEAFIGDVSAPLKSLLPDYREVELRVEAAVRSRFGLPLKFDSAVKHADLVALATEQRDLMPRDRTVWTVLQGIAAQPEEIEPLTADEAFDAFITRAVEIHAEGHWPQAEISYTSEVL